MQLFSVCWFLYSTTLLNTLISSNSFLVTSLGFSIHQIILPANKDNFIPSLTIWMPLFLFFYLIILTRTSSTVLSRSDESGHPCLVSDLRKLSTFHHSL